MRPTRVLLLALPLTVASCSITDPVCACSPVPPVTHVITGVVRFADRAPASGLLMRAVFFDRACAAGSAVPQAYPQLAFSDGEGRFRLAAAPINTTGVPVDSGCVRVSAYLSPETSAELGSVEYSPVRIWPYGTRPLDSLHVELIAARPGT